MIVYVSGLLATLFYSSGISAHDTAWAIPPGILGSGAIDSLFIAKSALFIGIILLWVTFAAELFKKLFKIPTIAGQIIAGLFLGPSCFNSARWSFFYQPLHLYDHLSGHAYTVVGSDTLIFCLMLFSSLFTISYLLWIAGHETDVHDILKVGWIATLAGFLGAVLPIALTFVVMRFCFPVLSSVEVLGLGLVLSATSVSIPVAMLFAYNKMHLKSSQATLGAAIIDDILAVILLSLFFISVQSGVFGAVQMASGATHSSSVMTALISMVCAFAALLLVGVTVVPLIVSLLKKHNYGYLLVSVATIIMLFYFAFAELAGGLAGITGAYFAGLFYRLSDKTHSVEKVISPFIHYLLLPLFLGLIGFSIDITLLSGNQWLIVLILLLVAVASKLIGCFVAIGVNNLFVSPENRWSWLEGYLFGSSMVARGEVGLVIATILYGAHIVSVEYFTIILVVIVLTTIVSPIMLGIGFAYEHKSDRTYLNKEYKKTIHMRHVLNAEHLLDVMKKIINHKELGTVMLESGDKGATMTLVGQEITIQTDQNQGVVVQGNKEQVMQLLTVIQEALHNEVDRIAGE